jgi:hypothetical protein
MRSVYGPLRSVVAGSLDDQFSRCTFQLNFTINKIQYFSTAFYDVGSKSQTPLQNRER